MKRRTSFYYLFSTILIGLCLLAGFSGYRIHAHQPPRARLFVVVIPGLSWSFIHKLVEDRELSNLPPITTSPRAYGEIIADRQPTSVDRMVTVFFDSSVNPDLVSAHSTTDPVWKRFGRAGQQVILAGWENAIPHEEPLVLNIPSYNRLKQFMTSSRPCPLDRRLPGWRRIVAGMHPESPDKVLLRLVERARHTMPDAHILLTLTSLTQMTGTLDMRQLIKYYRFLDQSLIPFMNQLSMEGTTVMLISGYGRDVSINEPERLKEQGVLIAWGPCIRQVPYILSATPDDMALTLLYLANAPIDRHQKGAVLGPLLEDGLIFRRPVVFHSPAVVKEQKTNRSSDELTVPVKNNGKI